MMSELVLRPYQAEACGESVRRRRLLVAYDRGLGKTPISLHGIRQLVAERIGIPVTVLIVGNKLACGTFADHIEAFYPDLASDTIVYGGTPTVRTRIWDAQVALGHQLRIVVANYSMVSELLVRQQRWTAIVADEAHKLCNRRTNLCKAFAKFRSELLWLLTGNDVVNAPSDVWSLLHLIAPRMFTSYWSFLTSHVDVVETEFGRELGGVKDVHRLAQVLKPYVIRKTKQEVLTELPPKHRGVIHVELSQAQRAVYDELAEELMVELETPEGQHKLLVAPNTLSQMTRLRQLLVHPGLLESDLRSTAVGTLIEALEDDFREGRAAVVFTPFAAALPLLFQELPDDVWKGIIRGGLSVRRISQTIKDFQTVRTTRKVLLCSLFMGESWTATEASVSYFLGFGWNPKIHEQAEDRIHRFGQTRAVDIRYFVHKNTIDEQMLNILNRKLTWANQVRDPQRLLRPRK